MNVENGKGSIFSSYLKDTLWVSFAKVRSRAEKLKLPTLWKGFLQNILAMQYEDLAIGKHTHIYIQCSPLQRSLLLKVSKFKGLGTFGGY